MGRLNKATIEMPSLFGYKHQLLQLVILVVLMTGCMGQPFTRSSNPSPNPGEDCVNTLSDDGCAVLENFYKDTNRTQQVCKSTYFKAACRKFCDEKKITLCLTEPAVKLKEVPNVNECHGHRGKPSNYECVNEASEVFKAPPELQKRYLPTHKYPTVAVCSPDNTWFKPMCGNGYCEHCAEHPSVVPTVTPTTGSTTPGTSSTETASTVTTPMGTTSTGTTETTPTITTSTATTPTATTPTDTAETVTTTADTTFSTDTTPSDTTTADTAPTDTPTTDTTTTDTAETVTTMADTTFATDTTTTDTAPTDTTTTGTEST